MITKSPNQATLEDPRPETLALTREEVARMLNISVRNVADLTAARKIPHVRFGRSVRYPIDAIRAWLQKEADRAAKAK